MYKEHSPSIQALAMSEQGVVKVVDFVLSTINRHFDQTSIVLNSLYYDGIENCRFFSGQQKRGLEYIRSTAQRYTALSIGHLNPIDKVKAFLEIPGLGIPKAGFCVQLLYGQSGCLDVHNLRRAGLDAKVFRTPTSTAALTDRLVAYHAVIDSMGGTGSLWDSWCILVAARYPKIWKSAEHVSAYHCQCLGLL